MLKETSIFYKNLEVHCLWHSSTLLDLFVNEDCIMLQNMLFFTLGGCYLLALNATCMHALCRLSVSFYKIFSELTSISTWCKNNFYKISGDVGGSDVDALRQRKCGLECHLHAAIGFRTVAVKYAIRACGSRKMTSRPILRLLLETIGTHHFVIVWLAGEVSPSHHHNLTWPRLT
jgi:hypothetical protein